MVKKQNKKANICTQSRSGESHCISTKLIIIFLILYIKDISTYNLKQ